jgi:hypothetical protein
VAHRSSHSQDESYLFSVLDRLGVLLAVQNSGDPARGLRDAIERNLRRFRGKQRRQAAVSSGGGSGTRWSSTAVGLRRRHRPLGRWGPLTDCERYDDEYR